MTEETLYTHLEQFVHAFGPIFTCLPTNLKSMRIFTAYMPLKFEANIIVMDWNQKYYFRVSLEDYYIKRRNFNFCELTLIANSTTWIKIFSGQTTLMGEYNLGNVLMTSVRNYYVLKTALLSGILFSFATKKQRLIRAGKYFKFPLFNRRIFTPIFTILIKILKYIPVIAIERLMKRISPLLEEFE